MKKLFFISFVVVAFLLAMSCSKEAGIGTKQSENPTSVATVIPDSVQAISSSCNPTVISWKSPSVNGQVSTLNWVQPSYISCITGYKIVIYYKVNGSYQYYYQYTNIGKYATSWSFTTNIPKTAYFAAYISAYINGTFYGPTSAPKYWTKP